MTKHQTVKHEFTLSDHLIGRCRKCPLIIKTSHSTADEFACVLQLLYEKMLGNNPRLMDSTTVALCESTELDAVYSQRTFSPSFHEFVDLCLKLDPTHR